MKKIRIGNDIEILWAIYIINGSDKSPYDLTGKNLSLYLKGPKGRIEVSGHTADKNILKWTFYGKDQHHAGTYSLELVENEGCEGMHTIDQCNAFSLVKNSCEIYYSSGSQIECIRPTKHSTSRCNYKNDIECFLLEFSSILSIGIPHSEIDIDGSLSLESENPVQNKVVTKAIVELNTSLKELQINVEELQFPTVNPTFTAPSASMSLSSYAAVQEVGADAPSEDNFSTLFNAGQIILSGEKQNDRAGSLDTDKSFIYYGDNVSNVVLPTEVAEGNTSYKYRAVYAEGPQPVDSKGNNYATPLAAGYVDSSAVTVNGTWPWYASTANASAENPVVKQSLVSWSSILGAMSTGKFTVQPSGTLPQVFKLPRPLVALQMLNTISGQMDTIGTTDYTESTEVINGRTYYVYTYDGAARGSVTLLAKF